MAFTEITGLNDSVAQTFAVNFVDGTNAVGTLRYSSEMLAWFLELKYKEALFQTFLVGSADLLQGQKHNFPFALSCLVANGSNPFFLTDFAKGRVKLVVTTTGDIDLFINILRKNAQ